MAQQIRGGSSGRGSPHRSAARHFEIARQKQQIAVQNKRPRRKARPRRKPMMPAPRRSKPKKRVGTARESEIAERQKKIELIEAAKQADTRTRSRSASMPSRAVERCIEPRRSGAARGRRRCRSRKAARRGIAGALRGRSRGASARSTRRPISCRTTRSACRPKLALAESAARSHPGKCQNRWKRSIRSRSFRSDGLSQWRAPGENDAGGSGGGWRRIRQPRQRCGGRAALALTARRHPVLDGLMKELGLDGSSLSGLVKGAAEAEAQAGFACRSGPERSPHIPDAESLSPATMTRKACQRAKRRSNAPVPERGGHCCLPASAV